MSRLYTEKISQEIFLVGEINGYKCKNISILYSELSDAFKWPPSESSIEAMFHLDWVTETNFKIIVKKFNAIKDENHKKLIKEQLNIYKEHWNKKTNKNNFIIEYK